MDISKPISQLIIIMTAIIVIIELLGSLLTFTEPSPCARQSAKSFTYIISFNPHKNPGS